MSVFGNFLPMTFVFPRARQHKELLDGAPPGSTAEYHQSGWVQMKIFLKWFHRFTELSKPTERKLLLLRLESQTKGLELIELARESHVVLSCFPSHTSHRLQPLDVSFMDPLNQHHSDGSRKCLQLHPGRVVTIKQVPRLYGAAFVKAASVERAVNDFRNAGISHWIQTFFFKLDVSAI
jgi:hypothetical protein